MLVFSTTETAALCAGADVGEQLDEAGGVARMAAFTRMYTWLDEFPVPIIAVAVGNCVGPAPRSWPAPICGSAATTCSWPGQVPGSACRWVRPGSRR